MKRAGAAFDETNFSRGHEILTSYLPMASETSKDDPRSFYWYWLWRTNHQEIATLKGHGNSVFSVSFSPDAKTLASGSGDGTVKLWHCGTRQERATLKGPGGPPRGPLRLSSRDRTRVAW